MSDYKTKLTLYGIVRVIKKMCRFYMCRSRSAKKIIAGNISDGIPFPKKLSDIESVGLSNVGLSRVDCIQLVRNIVRTL